MDLNEKFQILLRKFNLGKFDEVIFESTLMAKKKMVHPLKIHGEVGF